MINLRKSRTEKIDLTSKLKRKINLIEEKTKAKEIDKPELIIESLSSFFNERGEGQSVRREREERA